MKAPAILPNRVLKPVFVSYCEKHGSGMVQGMEPKSIECDLRHRQLYTKDDIRSNDESIPRSAFRCLDDWRALSLTAASSR
jgi:hypothetical protein